MDVRHCCVSGCRSSLILLKRLTASLTDRYSVCLIQHIHTVHVCLIQHIHTVHVCLIHAHTYSACMPHTAHTVHVCLIQHIQCMYASYSTYSACMSHTICTVEVYLRITYAHFGQVDVAKQTVAITYILCCELKEETTVY